MTTGTRGAPKLGVTLYSFTRAFHSRQYDVWQLIEEVGKRKLGPGLEVVGFQSIRGFPEVSDEFVGRFRDLTEKWELTPSCLGLNADRAMRRDRDLTDDELTEYMAAQLRAAKKLGFPLVRIQYSVNPAMIRRLLPLVEQMGITMAMEIHCTHSVHHEYMLRMRDTYEELGSPLLGFIPDWGASVRQPSPSIKQAFVAKGAPAEGIDRLLAAWQEIPLPTRDEDIGPMWERLMPLAFESGLGQWAQPVVMPLIGLSGHQAAHDWVEFMPWIRHVHGKFFDIDASGDELAVDHQTLLRDLVEGGYTGYISSEWEGWHWITDKDAFEVIDAQHALSRRILSGLGVDAA